MDATASGLREGTAVQDRWGGRWVVRSRRAPVRPAEPRPGVVDALSRLLTPWSPGQDDSARPRASWVMGRSARWHGPDAPGSADDSTLEGALAFRGAVSALSTGWTPSPLALAYLARRAVRAVRAARDESSRPWLMELVACGGPERIATWETAGPGGAQAAADAVADAVRARCLPAPAGARLVEVRDARPRRGER